MDRKMICLFLLMILVCWSMPVFAKVDLTPLRKDNDLYVIDVTEDGNAFINTRISEQDLMYIHKYSLTERPSYTHSDIFILDYFGSNPRAFWRIWFRYYAKYFLGITSITITMDDVEYTFTGVGGKERMQSGDSYVVEGPNILIGKGNFDFWNALLLKCEAYEDGKDILNISLPVVLHGTEDVETEISGTSVMDMFLMGETLLRIAGLEAFTEIDGTSMTTVNLKPAKGM